MKDWTRISSFTLPHEAHLAKARLESEGIEVLIKDELTTQIHNFYSNAIGGVKIFVKNSDAHKAKSILIEARIILPEQNESESLLKFDRITKKIPFIGRLNIEFRIIVLAASVIVSILIPTLIFSLPNKEDQFVNKIWCIKKLYFNGQEYLPETTGILLHLTDFCDEAFKFEYGGSIVFPGFKSKRIYGNWKMEDKKVVIYNVDYFDFVYKGIYEISFSSDKIYLESANTIIIGEEARW